MSIVPTAVPHVPNSMYHARILLRSVEETKEDIVDSSIALKGPISLPLLCSPVRISHEAWKRATYLGLITPSTLAATRTQ